MTTALQTGRSIYRPPCIIQDQLGEVFIADDVNGPRRWDGKATSTTQMGVTAPTTALTAAANGSGGSLSAGTYYYYYRYVTTDGKFSNLSPVASIVAVSNDRGNLSVIAESSDTRVASKQIWRTIIGDSTVIYLVTTITNGIGTTTYNDGNSDATIQANQAEPILNDDGTQNMDRFGLPPKKAVLLGAHDRLWALVDCEYKQGSVEVTQSNGTWTGRGTAWTSHMIGKKAYLDGDITEYTITAVASATSLTATPVVVRTTNQFNKYCIRNEQAERNKVWRTRVLEPESWPTEASAATTVYPWDWDILTGGFICKSYLFVTKRHHTYRLVVSANETRLSAQSSPLVDCQEMAERGAVNNRSIVKVEQNVYLLDEEGVWWTDGSAMRDNISEPIQDYWREDRINWKASEFFFASHSPDEDLIRFHVALGVGYLPKHALTFDYRSGEWTVEDWPFALGSASLVEIGGKMAPIFGGEHEKHHLFGRSLDGTLSQTLRGTATSATALSLTDTAAAFPSDIVGCSLCIVEGPGKHQRRKIVANTSGRLDINFPWNILPTTASKYQVGGIPWRMKTGVFRFPETDDQEDRRVAVSFTPTDTDESFDLRRYLDMAEKPDNWVRTQTPKQGLSMRADEPDAMIHTKRVQTTEGTTWDQTGLALIPMEGRTNSRGIRNRFVEFELRGVQGYTPMQIHDVELKGVIAPS